MEESQVEDQVVQNPPDAQEQEQNQVESHEEQKQPEPVIEKSKTEINWEQAQYALKMQKQRIEELEQRLASQIAPKVEEKDEFAELDPSDYVTVEKAQRMAEKKARVAAKEIVQEYMQQQNLVTDEQRMRTKHEDYDFVIETYAVPLIKNDPALAHKIQTSKNPAETAYKLGKLADNYEDPMKVKENTQKVEKIIKNSSRPTSGNAIGAPLKGQADQVTKMSPQQIWEQSQKYARGA